MSAADRVARALSRVPSVRSEVGVFVRMDGALAVVNLGASTVKIPCVGTYPPAVGMSVQVEWRAGRPAVVGPARQANPIGTITATGSPRATVDVDGEEFLLYLRDGYTPSINDTVEINWDTGVIQGKVTGLDTAEAPDEAAPAPKAFDLTVLARDSGRYQTSWWGNDPWASSSNDGIWTYGTRNRDALKGAVTFKAVRAYLPAFYIAGACQIGLHAHSAIPGGAPTITNLTSLDAAERTGWVDLPVSWGAWLRDNTGGIGVLAPGGAGWTKWTGTDLNSRSGALRFIGTR